MQAQEQRDLNKEIQVRTSYQPKINKASRIGELPVILDTTSFTPNFTYFVLTRPLSVAFTPAVIPAAKIVGEPLKPIYSSSLSLAGGNYSSLFGDYRFNNQRSKTTDIGFHLRHYSTNGKLKLENGNKEKPDWVEQLAEVYGSAYLEEGELSGRVFYQHLRYNYFGFPKSEDVGDIWQDLFPYEKQKQNIFGLSADFQSNLKDAEKPLFDIGLSFNHFADDIAVKENDLDIDAKAKIRHGDGFWSLLSKFEYFAIDGLNHWKGDEFIKERKTLKWSINPQYLLQTGRLNLKLGAHAVLAMGDDSKTKIYPDISIDVNAVDGILSLFAGIDGDLEMNKYKSIAKENSFIFSGLNVLPSNKKYRLYGGVKGSISSKASFSLTAEYAAIDQQYFFVKTDIYPPDAVFFLPTYSNKFGVLYDDISLLKLQAEANIEWTDRLKLNSKFTFYHYSLNQLADAWHKPQFELNVNGNYQFTKELNFKVGVNIIGERPVLYSGQNQALDAVYDFNVGANYLFNEHFTTFVVVNNLFADRYYRWEGYPSQGFNFLIGVKILF
ncbi:hypothetical protein DLK05_09175 [Ancylomarina longa]|uniref:TonB-dependent receptor n=2 Tax=Ancylomarina longa TaxID=2487017 RepID=A0A434AV54_9BACT|nr:hypothetical protein DLK05_09175 [Ancylomarina longa]